MAKKAKHAKHIKNAIATGIEQPVNVAPIQTPVMIIIAGRRDKDGSLVDMVTEDAAKVPQVTADSLRQFGLTIKAVNVGLTMNLLAGTRIDAEICKRDSEVWLKLLKDEKRAFFYITENANAEVCRMAWDAEVRNRKRIDCPTLQTLSKAVRAFKAGAAGAFKLSPMGRFARGCLDTLNDRTKTEAERLQGVRALLEAKAEFQAEAKAKQTAAKLEKKAA